MKSQDERKAILEAEINHQLKKGWRIIRRTNTTCQLIIDKKADTFIIIVLLLLFIIPLIVYLIVRKKTISAYLEVNEKGEVIYSSKDMSPHSLQDANKQANKRATKVSNQPIVTNQQTNDLGLLTTKNISDGLNITEEEVVKLITSNQIKGKVIGEKYFVRKEDFDEFMKK